MRKPILLILVLFLCCFCNSPHTGLQTGDLIFVGIPSDYRIEGSIEDAISASTSDDADLNIIHTAIAEVKGDSVWIIDATIKHGVDRHPLDTFLRDFTLKDGSLPKFIVMRLKDNSMAPAYVEIAKNYLGLAYNNTFMPCDTALYCTELVRNSYVNSDGSYVFSEAPMNFLAPDGTMPVYWEEIFALLGRPVPQGEPGTNPNAMMHEACLEKVNDTVFDNVKSPAKK